MARFTFRLQTLLDHRRRIEDGRQRDLAKALRAQMILRDQLRQMQDATADARAQLGRSLVGRVDLEALGQFTRYSGQSAERAREIAARLSAVSQQIDAARDALALAMRDRKALELLEERHRRSWGEDQRRREAAELDEPTVQGHGQPILLGLTD